MWNLYYNAKRLNSRPSELIEDIDDTLARYCLDATVVMFGTIVENALADREKVGDEWQNKHTLPQLLDPKYHLPRPKSQAQARQNVGNELRTLAGKGHSGVKRWKQKQE